MKRIVAFGLLGILILIVNSLIFLIVNVLWGQAISLVVRDGIDQSNFWVIIVFGGFLVSSGIAIVGSYFLSTQIKDFYIGPVHATIAGGLAILTNLVMWLCVAYIKVSNEFGNLIAYPDEPRLFLYLIKRGLGIIGGFPRILAIMAIYMFPNLISFWLFTNLTFTIYFILFLMNLR